MRLIIVFCALLSPALADSPFVLVESDYFAAIPVDGASTVTATAPLIYGGLAATGAPVWEGRVVLMDRGEIPIIEKVRHVVESGGLAAIIINNVDGPAIRLSLGSDNSAAIPVFTVSKTDGGRIKNKLGIIAKVGFLPTPPIAVPTGLPDPIGHDGEFVAAAGGKFVFARPPAITPSATQDSAGVVGKPVTFGVTVLGIPPFKFVWLRDGIPLPGQIEAVLTIAAARPEDSGLYVCQVTNPFGTGTSGGFQLTVR